MKMIDLDFRYSVSYISLFVLLIAMINIVFIQKCDACNNKTRDIECYYKNSGFSQGETYNCKNRFIYNKNKTKRVYLLSKNTKRSEEKIDIENILNECRGYFYKEKYRMVIGLLRKNKSWEKTDGFSFYYFYGISLCKLKHYKEAYDILSKALKLNKNDPDTHYYLGIANYANKNYKEATREWYLAMKNAIIFNKGQRTIRSIGVKALENLIVYYYLESKIDKAIELIDGTF